MFSLCCSDMPAGLMRIEQQGGTFFVGEGAELFFVDQCVFEVRGGSHASLHKEELREAFAYQAFILFDAVDERRT